MDPERCGEEEEEERNIINEKRKIQQKQNVTKSKNKIENTRLSDIDGRTNDNNNKKLENANSICSLKRNDSKFHPSIASQTTSVTRQINAKFIFIELMSRQAATSPKRTHSQINKNDAMKSNKHIEICARTST